MRNNIPHKIVIVDDHQVVCSGFERLVDSFPGYEVLYTVANGQELLDRFQYPKNIPDLVLLDINMPIMDGYQTMEILHAKYPDVKVLVLSTDDGKEVHMKMMELGANGFLSKMVGENELRKGMESIFSKGFFYTEEITGEIFKAMRRKKIEPEVLISENEKRLLSYIGTDMTYKDIAKEMCLSVKTIDSYRNSLFQKLDIGSRQALAVFAFEKGYFKK